MKTKDIIRIAHLDAAVAPFEGLAEASPPRLGWVRAIREALGMTSAQLAKRIHVKAPQTIEDMQEYEATGTIKLQTLRKLAAALECDLVYALVPKKPLQEIRREQAERIARRTIGRISNTMKLEDQGVRKEVEELELKRRIDKLLNGNPKALWD